MLLKCCTQYVSKFRKLISGHRTGSGQFSFQSQRRVMPKNVQNSVQVCSFHMLARLCSKSFKLGFRSRWSKNFQMDFKEAEEPEIKLSTFAGSWQKQGNSGKASTSTSLSMLKPLTVDHNKLWKILKEMGTQDPLTCLLRNLYVCNS